MVANYLKTHQRQQVIALLELGWTYRRIEAETGVRRETVSRYDRKRRSNAAKVFPGSERLDTSPPGAQPPPDDSNAAKVFPGSGPNPAKVLPGSVVPARSAAAAYREVIVEKIDARLSVQRIWQDLVEEYGYGYSYESVKRYVRELPDAARPAGVIHAEPGAKQDDVILWFWIGSHSEYDRLVSSREGG